MYLLLLLRMPFFNKVVVENTTRDAFLASCSSDTSLGMAQNEHCDKPRKIKSFENNNLQTRENKNNSIPGGGRKSLAALGRSNAVNKSPIVPAISLSTTNSLEQEENSGMYDNFFKKSKTHVAFSIPKMKIFEPFC